MIDNSSVTAELIKEKVSEILSSGEPLCSEEELRFRILAAISDSEIDGAKFSLEFPFEYKNSQDETCKGKVDAILWDKGDSKNGIAFEFKYAHKELECHGKTIGKQIVTINTRYNFLNDIYRLECLINDDNGIKVNSGYAIFVTNLNAYWENNGNQEEEDPRLSLYDGRQIHIGEKCVHNTESDRAYNTMPIVFSSEHTIKWNAIEGSDFRCCIVKVGPKE